MTASAIILVIAAYFWGAIPVAYLVVKGLRGVDLRAHGSGSVGSSNAAHVVGRRIAVATGVVEVLKGATPIWVAQALDLEIGQQMAAGVACIVGHNWSVWMRFKGGRGMSILFGVMLAVARLELLLFTIVGLFGIAFWGSVPLFLGLSAALLPMWSWLLERSEAYILGLGLMVLVVVLKRLLGNELPEKWSERIIFYRLFFDRDVRDRDEWVRRGIKTKPARDDSSPPPPSPRRPPTAAASGSAVTEASGSAATAAAGSAATAASGSATTAAAPGSAATVPPGSAAATAATSAAAGPAAIAAVPGPVPAGGSSA